MWRQPSLEFEVKVVRVAGFEPRLEGGLFVRYYVPAGDGRRRLRVDTREVPCGGGGNVFWGELARFERWNDSVGAGQSAGPTSPASGGVAFELRWRPRPASGLAALLGTGRPSSRVLARAVLAWQDIAVAAGATSVSESWLRLSPASRELGGCKALKLLVEVKINAVAAADDHGVKASKLVGMTNECCGSGEHCDQCGWVGSEEDMFLAATFSQQEY